MKIIVAGHICADITPVFGTRFRDIRPAELLRPGQLVMVDSTVIGGGGCVSNTGLALRKLGMDTITIGKIGKDAFGFALKKLFSEYGASGLICDDKSTTSYSYAIAVPGFDRIFIHDPGANNTFVSADVSDEVLGSADYFHFGYPCLMRSIYRDGGKELVSLFKRAKSFGLITSLDFSTILPGSEAAEVEWEEILGKVLPYVDFFVPSFEELCFMTDRKKYDEFASREGDITAMIDIETDAKELAEKVLNMGSGHALIKCGEAGLYYRDNIREIVQPCFTAKEVKSGAGAGDACIAAFLAALMLDKPIEDCVLYAAAEGACCVEEYDSLSGVKSLDEIDERVSQGWK